MSQRDLMAILKAETANAHAQIEEHVNVGVRARFPDLYRDWLERLYGFHVVWEPRVERVIADPGFMHERRKLPWLVEDLSFLSDTPAEIRALSTCQAHLPMDKLEHAIGWMYVIEGSTLGGGLIADQVNRHLGFGVDGGCRYFNSYGHRRGSMWKRFGDYVTSHSAGLDEDETVQAAERTFVVLQDWVR